MNTHLKQLWAAMKLPEKLQKSYKFFCRGLDIRVAQTMDIQIQRQVVCFQYQLKAIGKCAGIHRLSIRLAEQVVILVHGFVRGLLPIPLTLFPPRFKQLAHFLAQIYHSVTAGRLRVFCN